MKRPFAYLGFSYALWLLVAFFLPETFYVYLISFAVLVALVLSYFVFIRKNVVCRYFLISSCSLIICMTMLYINSNTIIKAVRTLSENEYTASGEITEVLPKDGNVSALKISVDKVLNQENEEVYISDINVVLYTFEENTAKNYDEISFTADFYEYEDKIGLSSAKTKYAQGIHMYAFESAEEKMQIKQGESKPIFYFMNEIKAYFENVLDENISKENVDVLSSMLLGNREDVDFETNTLYSLIGVSHVLVVSGMHIAILSFALTFVLDKFIKNKKILYSIVILFILFYMAICGFGFSVVRSGIMLILMCIAQMIGADVDGLNSLGIACFLICFINPYAILDLGFILSLSATLGIILVYGKLILKRNELIKFKNKFVKAVYNAVSGVFLISFSANLFTMPIILLFFNSANLFGFINSAILSPLFSVVIIMGFILIVLSALPFSIVLGRLIDVYLDFLTWVIYEISNLQILTPSFSDEISTTLFTGTVIVLFVYFITKKIKYKTLVTALSLVMIYSVAILSNIVANDGLVKLLYMPTSSKPFVALVFNNEAAVISSGDSGYSDVAYFMKDLGVRKVSYLQILDPSTKERQTIDEIGKMFEVDDVVYDRMSSKTFYPFDDNEISIVFYEDSFNTYVEIYDSKIVLEGIAGENISADIAFLSSADSMSSSALNVLSYHSFPKGVGSGNYIISGDDRYIFTFDKDNTVKIRSESSG